MPDEDAELLNDLAESIIASFDSKIHAVWGIQGTDVQAHFLVNEIEVSIIFVDSNGIWRVSFEVVPSKKTPTEIAASAFRIFAGVFQTVGEFLQIRQPEKLIFVSKDEGFAKLYSTHLNKQKIILQSMGYEIHAIQSSPFTEFIISKNTP